MTVQAGTMLHLAAQPRSSNSMTPSLTAGHHGLLRSLASSTALGPSTTWVPPSDWHPSILTMCGATAKVCPVR